MIIDKLVVFSETGAKNTDGLNLSQGFPSKLQPARQWFNWLFNSLTLKINEVIDGLDSNSTSFDEKLNLIQQRLDNEIGLVSACPFENIPDDRLECNGDTLLITDYPKLFEKIGILYGGDGVLNFKIPDYRAAFLRGLDNEKGIDSGRILGSVQDDAIKSHTLKTMMGGDNNTVRAENASVAVSSSSSTTGTFGEIQVKYEGATETRPRNISVIYVIKVK